MIRPSLSSDQIENLGNVSAEPSEPDLFGATNDLSIIAALWNAGPTNREQALRLADGNRTGRVLAETFEEIAP
jgi:hypothetical protein